MSQCHSGWNEKWKQHSLDGKIRFNLLTAGVAKVSQQIDISSDGFRNSHSVFNYAKRRKYAHPANQRIEAAEAGQVRRVMDQRIPIDS